MSNRVSSARVFSVVGVFAIALYLFISNSYSDRSVEQLSPKYADEHSQWVDVDGMTVHYRDQGSGPALVLIHGSNASLHTWDGWVAALENEFRLIRLDLPGHGLTGPHPEDKYSWSDAAKVINRFSEKLKLDRFSIVGNSMGGAIAWHYAVDHPEKIEKLILIDSRGIPSEESMPLSLKLYTIPVLQDMLTFFTPRKAVELSVQDVFGNKDDVSDKLVDRYFELSLREGNRRATITRLSNAVDYSYLDRLSQIEVPTLILWGEKDRWILPKYAHEFARQIANSQLIMYPKLGHTPMEEAPLKTAEDVKVFLQAQ